MPGVRAISKLDELGDSVRQVIKAYHGSPYDFDKFDAKKIGTGEGNQSYGNGLYFAGSEDVASQYRHALASHLAGKVPRPAREILNGLGDLGFDDSQQAWEAIRTHGDWRQRWDVGGAPADAIDDYVRQLPPAGRTYEVEIGVPEDSLLDYDSPFGKNSGVVAAEVLARKSPGIIPDQTLRAIQDGTWASRDFTYGDSPLLANRRIQKFSKTPEGAAALLDAGIPGIRYLDGMSRSAGDGTRNYVMFPGTEDSIRILRKYGMMAPIAAGAAAAGEEP
jgi:hypothetical protein